MNIWIVNPFDQLPNETDVPLRYWSLCKTFAMQGHDVVWWSSDYSHLTKTKRKPCLDTDGFSIRLIETPPYKKNISFARLRNHKVFADDFYREAMKSMGNKELEVPDRIVVSLPPLGVAEQAFKIRDWINHSLSTASSGGCQVVVDIMDAWPETFYQTLPSPLQRILAPILFAPFHSSAKKAYIGSNKISAVGQSYLELAKKYLGYPTYKSSLITYHSLPVKPMHLCYHGTDLDRFEKNKSEATSISPLTPTYKKQPLRAVYLGAMGSSYDLQTIIDVAIRWKAEEIFPFQIHFAGEGTQHEALKARSAQFGLNYQPSHDFSSGNMPRVVFHGLLGKSHVNKLLKSSHLALIPNCPDSLVACPYKAGEYAAAGLPMISCLKGELGELLDQWNVGSLYNERDAASLQVAFERYSTNLNLLQQQSLNARKMAQALFDRSRSYSELVNFITN